MSMAQFELYHGAVLAQIVRNTDIYHDILSR